MFDTPGLVNFAIGLVNPVRASEVFREIQIIEEL